MAGTSRPRVSEDLVTGSSRSSVTRSIGQVVRRLDHTVGRIGRSRSVLIEARTPMNLAVLRPVFEPLLTDSRLQVQFTGPQRGDVTAAFEEFGITRYVVDRSTVRWRRFDLYVNADPWEAVKLRRVARQLNFFHGVAGKYNLDCPTGLPLNFKRYDRVAFPNEGRRRAYVEAGIVPEHRAVLVGYPKADVLTARSFDVRAIVASLGLDTARATVIFAPTFSTASALNYAGEAIIETLLTSGCNVIAKLHDRSLDPDSRYTGGINWSGRLARFSGPHFLLATGGDSTPYVLASDVMVTDHSSIGFEFCAADRPLVVFDAPGLVEAARINPDKVALLRSAATVVSSTGQLADAIRDALAAPDRRSTERRRAAKEVFFHPGTATERALRLVYELLSLPFNLTVPVPMDATRACTA
jgi:CDP-Glycerol:Poly(glycerophosphate) glycerophosphotransferase